MEEQFIPLVLAKELKELGFDERCFAKYQKDRVLDECMLMLLRDYRNSNALDTAISAPLWQQAFDWCFKYIKDNPISFKRNYWIIQKHEFFEVVFDLSYSSEESLAHGTREDCLTKLIELCKNN